MVAALMGGLCFVVPAQAGMSRREHLAMTHCAHGHVVSCIHRAAIHRGVDYGTMLYIARRESRFDPGAKNPASTAAGLFQFLDFTWAGGWNPYRSRSVYSAKWNSLAAALALSQGHASWWAADY